MKIIKISHLLLVLVFWNVLYMSPSCTAQSSLDYSPYLDTRTTVEGQILQSEQFPKGTISFDPSIEYIGGETFILYKVARCEIHLFAELKGKGGYKRIYWVQYESYLPKELMPASIKESGETPQYDYSKDPYRIEMGGRRFYVSNNYHPIEKTMEELNAENGPEDSDFTHVARLLAHNGVNINGEVLSVRMVHLNRSQQQELMIIYFENMDGQELSVAKLDETGKESSFWEEVSRELRTRASQAMHFTFQEKN